MPKPKQGVSRATPNLVLFTAECANEVVILLAYCESRFPVGKSTTGPHAITGERYIELTKLPFSAGWLSPEAARIAAQEAFEAYSKDKSGTLYWRVKPEVALETRHQAYSYYMRLLISDKRKKY